MPEFIRSNIDPAVAGGSIPATTSASPVPPGAEFEDGADHAPPPATTVTTATQPSMSRRVRRFAREGARRSIGVTMPVVTPVLERTRRYLTRELHYRAALDVNHLEHVLGALEARLHATVERSAHEATLDSGRRLQQEMVSLQRSVVRSTERTGELIVQRSSEAVADHAERTVAQVASLVGSARDEVLVPLLARLERIETYTAASLRRLAISLGDGDVLLHGEFGYVICAVTDLRTISGVLDSGDLERGTRLLIERVLGAGDTFVDVGANVGIHTMAAAAAVGASGRVVAIEPFPPNAARVRRAAVLNDADAWVDVLAAAASDRAGTMALHLGPMSGHHSLVEGAAPGTEQLDVEAVRLDDVIAAGTPVTLLKIDVEGAELDVVRGAERLISENPDIVVIAEFGPSHLAHAGVTTDEWFDAFESLGFDWRVVDPIDGALRSATRGELAGVYSENLVFARAGAPVLESST